MRIYIEANVGAGKSTLLKKIQKYYKRNDNDTHSNIACIQEPVEEWVNLKDKNNNNILNLYYNNKERWSYTFQMYAFMTRIQSISKEDYGNRLLFIERSIYTDKNCFALLCKENNQLNELEWNLYNKCFNWLNNSFNVKPDAYIYIKTNPKTCFDRIQKRNRRGESNVELQYVEELHKKHEEWIQKESKNTNVLVIDGEANFDTGNKNFKKIIKQINEFLKQNKSDYLL
jgi:deoxyadenosine/deoxycytidine kinase